MERRGEEGINVGPAPFPRDETFDPTLPGGTTGWTGGRTDMDGKSVTGMEVYEYEVLAPSPPRQPAVSSYLS